MDKIWLGVDWGTHSSKWVCCINKTDTTVAGEIRSSTLVRVADSLIFSPSGNIPEPDERIIALKKIIIQDPRGQSFWKADREDTHSSLGEAVSFSFCALLCDIIHEVSEKRKVDFWTDLDIEVGFSLPNWIREESEEQDKKSAAALKHFHQAVSVSLWIFKEKRGRNLPVPGTPFSIETWKQLVNEALKAECYNENDTPNQSSFYNYDKLKWRYLMESCAAGLPYLRSIQISVDEEAPPRLVGLGKLLVIDVGAGSTDVGYMLRTIGRNNNENLHYLPPAATFEIAGNDLTDKLWEYYKSQGIRITWGEAENRKVSESVWHNLEFANNWRQQIARHVRDYVKGIPDERWLPAEVPLQVIVTGGSGVVDNLKDEIKIAVVEGLKARNISRVTVEKTKLINERLANWSFQDEAEYAKRAVSIGAADTDKPALIFLSKTDPPTKITTGIIRY